MKRIQKLWIAVLFISTLVSCQKEVNDNIINPVVIPVVNDSIYLDKLFDLYDTGSGVDTQEVFIFNYDAQKRIIKWEIRDFNTNDIYTEFFYYYSGNDSIPFKSELREYDFSGSIPDTTITYQSFDSNKRITRDSSLVSRASGTYFYYYVTDYSYAGNEKYGYARNIQIFPAPGINYTKDTATLDASGNILTSKRYKDYGLGYELVSTSSYTYDTHINQFAKQWINKAHQIFPFGETFIWEYMPYNNVNTQVEYIISSGPAPWMNLTNTYTYNSKGLTSTVVTVDGTDTETIIYTYKSL
jgi:hypothetical protein